MFSEVHSAGTEFSFRLKSDSGALKMTSKTAFKKSMFKKLKIKRAFVIFSVALFCKNMWTLGNCGCLAMSMYVVFLDDRVLDFSIVESPVS